MSILTNLTFMSKTCRLFLVLYYFLEGNIMATIPAPEDLTPEQKLAFNGYFNNPDRLFYGTSPQNAIENLRAINTQRANGEISRADENEKAWFSILHYEQKVLPKEELGGCAMGIKSTTQEILVRRMDHKNKILREGGEQALSHSANDVTRISLALERLRTGSYGACIDCGADINQERLEIIPEAERCTPCQTTFENNRH